MDQLESFGKPTVLVVPNRMHRLDARLYKQKYKDLIVTCPSVAKSAVSEIVAVDQTIEEYVKSNPNQGIKIHVPEGISPGELTYELELDGGKAALIFCDLLFNVTKPVGGRFNNN